MVDTVKPPIEWTGEREALAGVTVRGAAVRAAAPPSREALAELAKAGVGRLWLPLFGARREVHDHHAGEGAFDATVAALMAARSLGVRTGARTPITRSNARVLAEVPTLLRARGVSAWELTWPEAEGDGEAWTARITRLGLGVPPALAAAARAEKLGVEVRLSGLPHCAVGPFAGRLVPSPTRAYGERCGPCRARAACCGVDAAYLARFGEGELRTL